METEILNHGILTVCSMGYGDMEADTLMLVIQIVSNCMYLGSEFIPGWLVDV